MMQYTTVIVENVTAQQKNPYLLEVIAKIVKFMAVRLVIPIILTNAKLVRLIS